ncbi:uncharacterized protein LOC116199050 [Punica granatum]|uniref:Uncharacterized protein n=2 Tax=Punica granatum TaxID=22663 RepID=A0A218W0X5_PUNGR|nr:uncharacterized protein LOC116199050 [Punica granatum]OWM65960.1 hypothetical protein CDL15_Pgr015385 [Punica granatum]PKI66744.1 hypothetical protein CRG98_012939 [Punica granatum]
MKHFLLAILVLPLPLLLVPQAQGIRLPKVPDKSMDSSELIPGELPDSVRYQDRHRAKGESRKLLTTATTTTTTTMTTNRKANVYIDELPVPSRSEGNKAATSKGKNVDGNEAGATSKGNTKEGFSVKSSTTAPKHEHYPDIIDIAGMDYSPAKRKPPVHN